MKKIITAVFLLALIFTLPRAVASADTGTIDVWWPTNGTTLSGTTPFKAMLQGKDIQSYTMYWQVDGGQLNQMYDNYADYPHKEVMVDLSGWKWHTDGHYMLTFVAKDTNGTVLATKNIGIITNVQSVASVTISDKPISLAAFPTTSPIIVTQAPPAPATVSSNPLANARFYVNPNSNAKNQANIWRTSRPADALVMDKLALQADSKWVGNWNSNVQNDVNAYVGAATSRGEVPVVITYNIPGRDCGSYSAGGSASANAYRTWIAGVANGIANRKTVVVLEPDALAGITCLSSQDQATRSTLIKEAVTTLKAKGALVYIDAGNSNWVGASDMAVRLKNAGIDQADGFALNVSNFYPTADSITYGTNLSKLVADKHFIVDTSRNGNGSNGEWCNPSGRAVGKSATANTGNSLVDAFLWLKVPGESDGNCNGGPSAGVWWPEYALGLARSAGY